MADSNSRLDRLLKTLGGRELPPKLTSTPPEVIHEGCDDRPSEITSAPSSLHEPGITAVPAYSLAEPAPEPRMTALPAYNLLSASPDPQLGEPAPLGTSFVPFLAVTKFPYKFVAKRHMQTVASAFFDQNKIYDREWDIYYVHSPYISTPNPVTFIPEHQFLSLLEEIYEALPDVNAHISDENRESGLVVSFDEFSAHPDLRPRFLGHSTSRAQYTSWTENAVMPPKGPKTPKDPSDRTLKAFQESVELAIQMGKNKSQAAKAKRQADNLYKRQGWTQSLVRTQRYLGLVPGEDSSTTLPDLGTLSLTTTDPALACSHPFDKDVIFIAFDVEAYELPPRWVTEIGIATLDTRDLHNVAPGKNGEDWQPLIRARHFRIEQYKNYTNSQFVNGCPDKFDFGKSEFIDKNAVGKVVSKCFNPPFSNPSQTKSTEKRNVVLLGHDIGQDIAYLQNCGFNVLNSGSVIDTCDSADLYRAYVKDPQPRSLANIIYDHNMMAWNLHNAGNDAVYTVWAMLATCINAAAERGSPEAEQKREERQKEKMEAAVEQAKQRVAEDLEGW